ncbi:hypothetical protein UPYG_G00287680, partial [Umbra pygmaea]
MPICRFLPSSTRSVENTKTLVSSILLICGMGQRTWERKSLRQDSREDKQSSYNGPKTFAITSGIVARWRTTIVSSLIMWTGLLHHVTNKHTWSLGACLHEPLEDDTNREWIKKESSVHITLIQIVLNKRWLKDVHKYLTFRSTSELESFNNHILMYASKRSSFSPPVYEARTLLAALDYNYHVYRIAKRNSQGAYMYHKIYNKKSRRWNLYTIKSEKTYHYIRDLQSAILEQDCNRTRGCQGPV